MSFVLIALPTTVMMSALLSSYGNRIKTIIAIASLAAMLSGWYWLSEPIFLGEDRPWFDKTPYWQLFLFVVMLAGMFCRVVSVKIEEWQVQQRRRGRRMTFSKWEFFLPLSVSVMTFGGVLSAVSSHGVSFQNIVTSFQTGFFWQTLLARRSVDVGGKAAPAIPS